MPSPYAPALVVGVFAGLRAFTPFAALSWSAFAGHLAVTGTWAEFLASPITAAIATLVAIAEIVNDKLPNTPSRKAPPTFAIRVVLGAFCGAVFGVVADSSLVPVGAALGAAGAVAGTLGGAWARGKLAAAFGKDLPAALVEDAVAVLGSLALAFCAFA